MATLDPRIETIRKEYGLAHADFWELPQKKGTWIAKHAALELAAAKAGIAFAPPQVLEANGEAKCVALCVTGSLKDRSEWSVGEASPANNKNGYPYAMAEKRAKDRVILKLIGLHGLAYSEDEADDFKGTSPAPMAAPEASKTIAADINDAMAKARKWSDDSIAAIRKMNPTALAIWEGENSKALVKLKGIDEIAHRKVISAMQDCDGLAAAE